MVGNKIDSYQKTVQEFVTFVDVHADLQREEIQCSSTKILMNFIAFITLQLQIWI